MPVFFGETIVGQRMPNLTYMVGYEDLAAREKIWSTFVSHPEWKKMTRAAGRERCGNRVEHLEFTSCVRWHFRQFN